MAQKRTRINQDRFMTLLNLAAAVLAFIWVPITLALIVVPPLLFVIPGVISNAEQER